MSDDAREPSEERGDERNLTRRTLAGIQWTYAQTVVSTVLQLVVAGVLARLLDPAAFGLVALGTLTLRFVNYLARGGLTQALIQKPDVGPTDIRVAHTASTLFGLVFGALVWLGAPLAARIFDTPDVVPVLRWMALILPINNLGATAEAVLKRQLRFAAIAMREVISYVIGYAAVGLTMALQGAGVWALVAATITQSAVKSGTTYAVARHDVRPSLERTALRSLLSFGGRVSFISFFEFLGSELDTLAVGRFAGASALGYYNRAYYLAQLPIYHLQNSLSSVLFPAFTQVQHDVPRLRAAYLAALQIAAAFLLPLAAGMAVAAREIVLVVLGDQWLPAIEVLPWIAGAAALSVVTHFAAITAEARAALNPKIVISVLKVVVLIGLLLLAADEDLWAFGAALAGAKIVSHVGYLWLIRRVVDVRLREVIGAYAPALPAAAVVAGVVAGARLAVEPLGATVVVTLLAEVGAAAVALLLMLRLGPLTGARRQVAVRLHNAGVTRGSGRVAGVLRLLVGPGDVR